MSTLICEEPFSAAVESGLLQNVCHSCFLYSRERKLRFCSRCLTVHYCSVKCQRNDWHDHSAECKCLKKYSPRIPSCFVRLLARFYWKMSAKGQAAVSFNSRRCYDLADSERRSPTLGSSSTHKDDPERIKAIQKMPAPKDVSQLRSLLGLINFYGNFVKDLHSLRAPLNSLSKNDVVYTWTPECLSSFDKIKEILSSDLLLTHFDPGLPIIVAADASNYGMAATLSHRFADGCEIIYHASRCLTQPWKKYRQIEKEALSLIFAVQKSNRFIHGRHFTLRISAESIRTATQADRLIQLVIDYTKSGNRPKVNRHSPLWHYNNRRNTHYTKLIQAEDENAFKKVCLLAYDGFRHRKTCQDLPKMSIRGKAELQSWPKPRSPWTGVHADFAGPMEGRYYLLNVDAYSKWPEIVQMPSISSTATIQAMKWIFAKFGNPETLATDKGTQSTFFCSSYTVPFVRKEVWTRHVNQLRPRIATTAANTFLDVFDVPLLDSASKNDGATLTADSFQ
ncbi:hypothetical protein RB195_023383 [Necator americanus]|uniref:MYND finger n=1 Tax=Necator americanus TaxID=51031 RepID=A0ABR1EIZ6_NECAM